MRVGGLQTAFSAFFQHLGVDVGDCYAALRGVVDLCAVVEESEGDVAGTACYVEHFPASGLGTRGGGGRCDAGVDGADKMISGGMCQSCVECKCMV